MTLDVAAKLCNRANKEPLATFPIWLCTRAASEWAATPPGPNPIAFRIAGLAAMALTATAMCVFAHPGLAIALKALIAVSSLNSECTI